MSADPDHIDRTIRRMKRARVPGEQIAAAVGMTVEQLQERVKSIWRAAHEASMPPDPTPEEIRDAAARVRRGWTAEDRDRRRMKGGER